jgi:hypothetical protein
MTASKVFKASSSPLLLAIFFFIAALYFGFFSYLSRAA